MRVVVASPAQKELQAAIEFYLDLAPGLSRDLVDELDRAISQVAALPGSGASPDHPESTISLSLLARSVEEFRVSSRDHALDIAGVVINDGPAKFGDAGRTDADLKQLCSAQGWHLFDHRVPRFDAFPDRAPDAMPIFRPPHAPAEVCARFDRVADEFGGRIGLQDRTRDG